MLVKKTKRTFINEKKPPKPSFQMRIDFLMALNNNIRVSILKFLMRSRENGPQSFTSIKKAIENLSCMISTANLGYHLAELKKIGFIEHLGADTNGGYIISELGRKIVDIYFKLEDLFDEFDILERNDLEGHLYKDDILKLLDARNDDSHVFAILLEERTSESPVDRFIMDNLELEEKKKTRRKKGPANHVSLDSFA
jgi:DNA-binding HxlR family transcriptional regulator